STLAFPGFDGSYLPKQENEFVHDVMEELETFKRKSNRESVLLFPPLPSRLRYLIHRSTEDLPELSTFSVGESWSRRVVVCYTELRGVVEEDSDLESSSFYEEPPRSSEDLVSDTKPKASDSHKKRGPKRPDKPLYMPRAARQRLSLQSGSGPPGGSHTSAEASSSCSCISTSSDSCSCSDAAESTQSSSSGADTVCEKKQDLELSLQEAEPPAWDQTLSHLTALTLEEDEEEEQDKGDLPPVPNDTQQEETNTDMEEFIEEIKAHLKDLASLSIELVHNDYSAYEKLWLNLEEFGHVIEIYDFPSVFKTDDLLEAFKEFSDGGMKIKWVDNTHALGVFSTDSAALHALSICHPLLKVRALAEGSKKAKGKAFRRAEFIQPVKERPRTDCAVARRMVTRALGLQGGRRVQRY
ncbi:R3H and coiled-coil domain-containing protein 1, partial [Genypterus blacodes]|uniref:R3H and coiled-coil domain-containing protein 1 n=1 Tax=Genypterus blacodes TaxID=154954 RepID=UPI003F75A4F7